MPERRQVPLLQELCLQSTASLFVSLDDPKYVGNELTVEFTVRFNFDSVGLPLTLCNKLAVKVLDFISTRIRAQKVKHRYIYKVEIHGFSNFCHYIKKIDFNMYPDVLHKFFNRNFDKMINLKHFHFLNEKYKMSNIAMMNLKSVTVYCCTDTWLKFIAKNCPHIEQIKFSLFGYIPEGAVSSLLKCKNLRRVTFSSVIHGLGCAQLVIGLPKLEKVSFYRNTNKTMTKVLYNHYTENGPFGAKKIFFEYISDDNLKSVVQMFPELQHIKLNCFDKYADLTILNSLNRLKEFKLHGWYRGESSLYKFLEMKGKDLTILLLQDIIMEIDLKSLLIHISQYCSTLIYLKVSGKFAEISSLTQHQLNFQTRPFTNLKKLSWEVRKAVHLFEFVISRAPNIRYIQCGRINHSAVVNILKANPMEHLEELSLRSIFPDGNDVNMKTVELLLASCINLKFLSGLECGQISEKELLAFKDYICRNNFDLQIK